MVIHLDPVTKNAIAVLATYFHSIDKNKSMIRSQLNLRLTFATTQKKKRPMQIKQTIPLTKDRAFPILHD